MKKIKLNNGKFVILDDDDFKKLNQYRWYFIGGYAYRNISIKTGKKTTLKMHREILKPKLNNVVDHINRNKLDNRRCNLRICNRSKNRANMDKYKNNSSGFKGVFKNNDKWIARIGFNNKMYNCGTYKNKVDAAIAYNNMAINLYGNYALLNKI